MNKLALLKRIKELYEQKNQNITQYLKELTNTQQNTTEDILISYDFQAGQYTKAFKENREMKKQHLQQVVKTIDDLKDSSSILEVGIGEATSLVEIMQSTKNHYSKILGLDLSWSRIKYAKKLVEEHNIPNVELFTGDMFNIPLANNAVDIVYTIHALEPNGGKEIEALEELYRVANKYIVLVEPCYENGTEEIQKRMDKLGYVKNLKMHIESLGYKIAESYPLNFNMNPLNPANVIVIEKENRNEKGKINVDLCCPITKTPLHKIGNCYYSKESLLAYPIIDNIPCLMSNNAIIATKMIED
ncbi:MULTISPECIES: methyltransferase domain-containing protein [Lysinibacillus]|uniref:methyltransferase domain-containing protein n=1 Tax=Lysinibacillus TaxID=400634 RepID=UPI00258B80B2|nr:MULTISPECIES: methyltransferase domain-containing protein [Lysinibacillus]